MPWPPVLIAQDAAVDVGSVAGWIQASQWAFRSGDIESGYKPGKGYSCTDPRDGRVYIDHGPEGAAASIEKQSRIWPPVALTPDAQIAPASIPPGTIIYIDPPYLNTTGYKADFTRAQVCETAERWATAGARVYISEAEPIEALGWHHVEITSERKGQARTFGNTPEWLTCSHRPAWTPPQQSNLFTRPA
jgi:hypothetical protein